LRDQVLAGFMTLRVAVTAYQPGDVVERARKAGWSRLEHLRRLLVDQAGLRRKRRIATVAKAARFDEALALSSLGGNFNTAIPNLKIDALLKANSSAAGRRSRRRSVRVRKAG
jgi:hypothetical protein